MNYAKHVNVKETPQSEAILGRENEQVENSAGGFVFPVTDWVRFDRFLILGTEGGSYYASEKKLTKENAEAVIRCVKADGVRAVKRIVEISDSGRAPKNDPALFALAIAAKLGSPETKKEAFEALPKVARIGTHLFHFAEYVKAFGGWGRATHRAFANWYLNQEPGDLAFQTIKYQSRDGWSHRDLLRKIRPKYPEGERGEVFKWVVKGWESVPDAPPGGVSDRIWAFEQAKRLTTEKDVKQLVSLVEKYHLPHECVPTEAKNFPALWEALLPKMGLTALIRNLGKMTAVGLVKPMSDAAKLVAERLGDGENLTKSRVHPLAVLVAMKVYAQGHGERGKLSWEPVTKVIDALDAAFYKAFKNVVPTGKRIILALDVSGSMSGGEIAGMSGISPRVGSSAMALVTANVESNYETLIFSSAGTKFFSSGGSSSWGTENGVSLFNLSPRERLDDLVERTHGLPFGGTDCALPMLWATENRVPVDLFVIYTDNETWAGTPHPTQALQRYRQGMGIGAKLVTVGMVSNGFTIADPSDAGMFDVVGFDSATPQLISDFAAR